MEASLVDKNLARDCFHAIKLVGDEAIICQHVTRTDKKHEKIVFLCSITIIGFFEKGSKASLIEKFNVNKITSLQLIDKKNIRLTSGKFSISFEHSNAIVLFKFLVYHLRSILMPSELPKFEFDSELTGKIKNSQNLMKRFIYLNTLSKEKASPQMVQSLEAFLDQENLKIFDFEQFNLYLPCMETILECLEFQPSITSVKLPKSKKSNWPALANCLKNNTTIKHIYVQDQLDPTFKQVLDSLQHNKSTGLKKVTFIDTDIKEKDGAFLQKLISLQILDSIEFMKATTADAFSSILQLLVREQGFRSITSVGFGSIEGLHAEEIFVAMPFVSSVNFKNCNVNLSAALRYVTQTLTKIKINGGTALTPIPPFNVPKMLSDVKLSKVQFTPQSLIQLIKAFCTISPPAEFAVSFREAQMTEEQWNTFASESIEMTPSTTLKEFEWDENPISGTITRIITQFESLHTLSVSGSLTQQTILPFCECVGQCKALKTLIINGGSKKLGAETVTLIRGLRTCTNIEELIINDQDFGEEGALALADMLCVNKNIKYVEFENNNMVTSKAWNGFFEMVMDRGPPLEIPWPNEINQLYKDGVFKQKDLDHLHDCWINTKNGSVIENEEEEEEGGEAENIAFEASEEAEEPQEKPIELDWEINLPPCDLPPTDQITGAILQNMSYAAIIEKMHRI